MSEAQAALAAPAPGAINLNNIQGDILGGLPKKTEYYYFFQIINGEKFRQDLAKFVPLVKTAQGVIDDRKHIHDHKQKNKPGLHRVAGINVAFSHLGFQAMGVDDTPLLQDGGGRGGNNNPFMVGQRQDAMASLADNFVPSASGNIPDWDPAFLQPIHGVFLVAADCHEHGLENIKKIEEIFRADTPRASIHQVKLLRGDVRPGKESAHEHFGFLDGLSNPAIAGFDAKELPGQGMIPPGVILTGHDGDKKKAERKWATDGSYLVFRQLFQEVPEFNKYLQDNPIKLEGLSDKEGSELLGARMVGRWKSGAPIDITPDRDNRDLAKDPQRNNNFQFTGQGNSQRRCPFAAHIRKTNPRDDLNKAPGQQPNPKGVEPHRILRRGIQFGPEVTPAEKTSHTTQKGRGLLFVCYQSSIADGFQFQQQSWSNFDRFPVFQQTGLVPGLDPLIGQAAGGPRTMTGLIPDDPEAVKSFPEFIIPRGGEYFYSPSLKALRDTLAKAPTVKA